MGHVPPLYFHVLTPFHRMEETAPSSQASMSSWLNSQRARTKKARARHSYQGRKQASKAKTRDRYRVRLNQGLQTFTGARYIYRNNFSEVLKPNIMS